MTIDFLLNVHVLLRDVRDVFMDYLFGSANGEA